LQRSAGHFTISSPSVHNLQMFIVKHVIKHAQRFKVPSKIKFRTGSTMNNLNDIA